MADQLASMNPKMLEDPTVVAKLMQDPQIQEMAKIKPEGKVHREAYEVLLWVFYAIAILSASARATMKVKTRAAVQLDDAFHVAIVLLLTASALCVYFGMDMTYDNQAFQTNPLTAFTLPMPELLRRMNFFQRMTWSFCSVSWWVIFGVKYAFLYLFFQLLRRLPAMKRLWWATLIFTILGHLFCWVDSFMICPYLGIAARKCVSPEHKHQTQVLAIVCVVFDILTDLLIVTIPISLISQVRIAPKRKARLAIFLCLQVVMMALGITRVAGITYRGQADAPWSIMMQFIEACVAVALLSLTAFRSAFTQDSSRGTPQSNSKRIWYSSAIHRMKRSLRGKRSHDSMSEKTLTENGDFEKRLPEIPRGTMTGMRTFARGGHQDTFLGRFDARDEDEFPLYYSPAQKGMHGGRYTNYYEDPRSKW